MISPFEFLKKVEQAGLLKDGLKSGVIPTHYKKWHELKKDYDREIRKRPQAHVDIVHELSIKHKVSYSWAIRIINL